MLLRHPEVQEAVVYGVWEQANGEASPSQNIRAYIVKAKGSDLTAQDVDKFLAQQAPALQSLSGGAVFLEIITKATVSLELLVRQNHSCGMSNDRPRIINPTRDYSSSIVHLSLRLRTVSRSHRLLCIRHMIRKIACLKIQVGSRSNMASPS